MTFTPTEEQIAIVQAAQETTDNLAVIARAGAAKTSTLVLIAEALPKTDILCLAFNKKIAEEMKKRLPPNCEAKTLHGLGYKAWWQFIRKSCKIDEKKVYNLLKELIDNLPPDERQEAYDSMSETLDILRQSKVEGYLPDAFKGHWKPLVGDDQFFDNLTMEPTPLQIALVKQVAVNSFQLALQGQIDFDDMIFCPALCSVPWPRFPLTLVDESQDLSPINHHILKKLVRNQRIIAVGDPLQAIYGFRGAYGDSMDRLIDTFKMKTLKLTISFRCGRKIIENARWLAPDMRWPEWAIEGEVLRPRVWYSSELSNNDAIICRNNAPLFSMAIKMIEAGLLPEISGRDLAAPLKKIMKKLGKENLPKLAAISALDDWKKKELARARDSGRGQIEDKYQCILIMLDKTKDLGDAIAYLDHILSRDGRIYLMTGHKSKGLEFDNVYFLDQHLCNIARDQDANIKYVIETRAKKKLSYVTTETFILETADELEDRANVD